MEVSPPITTRAALDRLTALKREILADHHAILGGATICMHVTDRCQHEHPQQKAIRQFGSSFRYSLRRPSKPPHYHNPYARQHPAQQQDGRPYRRGQYIRHKSQEDPAKMPNNADDGEHLDGVRGDLTEPGGR